MRKEAILSADGVSSEIVDILNSGYIFTVWSLLHNIHVTFTNFLAIIIMHVCIVQHQSGGSVYKSATVRTRNQECQRINWYTLVRKFLCCALYLFYSQLSLAFIISNIARFTKQTAQWLSMVESFNQALKVFDHVADRPVLYVHDQIDALFFFVLFWNGRKLGMLRIGHA